MEIALAQLNPVAGDLERNARSIVHAVEEATRAGAALVVTPAHALTGPISPDRRTDPAFTAAVDRAFVQLAGGLRGPAVALERPPSTGSGLALLSDGDVSLVQPSASGKAKLHAVGGMRLAFAIADDALSDVASIVRDAGAQALIAAAASPYRIGAYERRQALCSAAAGRAGIPLYVVNAVGATEEGVFDGASFVTDASGALAQQLPAWHATVAIARLSAGVPVPVRGRLDGEGAAHVYQALVLAVREAAARSDARRVIVDAEDALDAALAVAIARDAVRTGDVTLKGPAASGVHPPAYHAARDAPPALRIVARNRSRAWLGASGAAPIEPSVLDLFADLSRTLERVVARYRSVIGGALTPDLLDDAAGDAQRNAAPRAFEQECDGVIAAVLEEGATREDLVARSYAGTVIDAVLRRLGNAQRYPPAVRITSRPGDAVFANAAS